LLLGLTTLWGLRLAIHLFIRWRSHGEDPRYAKIIARQMETKKWSWAKVALLTVFPDAGSAAVHHQPAGAVGIGAARRMGRRDLADPHGGGVSAAHCRRYRLDRDGCGVGWDRFRDDR
jgi:hypothetical protein